MVTDPVLAGAVEIVVAGKAEPGRRCHKSLADRVLRDIRHTERSVGAVEPVGAAHLVLRASEIGEYVIERPAGIAELAPMVEIFGLAADINHAVYR